MKRSWIGAVLLAALLLGSLLVTKAMVTSHETVETQLLQAADLVSAGDWNQAEIRFQQAAADWNRKAHMRGCFADHGPVEQIDAAFAALAAYARGRDTLTFSATCRSLARQVAAVGEAHKPVWWNLL